MMHRSTLVLFSGGMDSTVSLYWAIHTCSAPVHVLTILYGQRHRKEVECAREIWSRAPKEKLGCLHQVTLDPMMFSTVSSILGGDTKLDLYETVEEAVRATPQDRSYIPARNAIFLAVAANHLISLSPGGGTIVIGTRGRMGGTSPGFPDCTATFTEKMSRALDEAVFGNGYREWGEHLAVMDPLNMICGTREGTINLASSLPGCMEALAYSMTCFAGVEPPCGKCLPCHRRRQAFAGCGIEDPLIVRLRGEKRL